MTTAAAKTRLAEPEAVTPRPVRFKHVWQERDHAIPAPWVCAMCGKLEWVSPPPTDVSCVGGITQQIAFESWQALINIALKDAGTREISVSIDDDDLLHDLWQQEMTPKGVARHLIWLELKHRNRVGPLVFYVDDGDYGLSYLLVKDMRDNRSHPFYKIGTMTVQINIQPLKASYTNQGGEDTWDMDNLWDYLGL